MSTHVAFWTHSVEDRIKRASTSLDPLAESFRMLGLAIVGSATALGLIWLVS